MGTKPDLYGKLIFDGAFGTMLVSRGIDGGQHPCLLNVTNPEAVIAIHKKYVDAGAQVITSNTFGANSIALDGTGCDAADIMKKGCCPRAARPWV